MSINKQLEKVYTEILNKEFLEQIFEDKLINLSAPFLLNIDSNYINSNKRILFVGKETNKWWGKLKDFVDTNNSTQILQERYRAELFGGSVQNKLGVSTAYREEANWNNAFFIEYKKVRKELLSNTQGSLVWSNLLKFDNAKSTSYSRNTKDDESVIHISKEIFKKELEILKPDYIIFAVSYTYDGIIKEFFKDEIKDSEVIESKSLWKFKIGDTICYRTWHPSTIKYKAKKGKLEYYQDIITDIKLSSL